MDNPTTVCKICGKPLSPSYIGTRKTCFRCKKSRNSDLRLSEEKKEILKIIHSFCRGEAIDLACPTCPLEKFHACDNGARIKNLRKAAAEIERMRRITDDL